MKANLIIYFYVLPSGSAEAAKYQHNTICLAEGLKELGVEYYASCDYWLNSIVSDDYLLRCNKDVLPADCDIVVIESSYIETLGLPVELKNKRRGFRAVLIDNADGVRTLSHTNICKYFDVVFRAHYNTKDVYYAPEKVKPWAFGVSNRMLKELDDVADWSGRERKILASFGCMHPLRRRVVREFLPKLQDILEVASDIDDKVPEDEYHALMWKQTGRRHYPEYYVRLKNIAACAAFGGLTPPAWEVESNIVKRLWRRRKEGYKKRILVQWDSWRFWESLVAGAVTFHVDFEKNDLLLPVMPENMKHYIGVDLDNIGDVVDVIRSNDELLSNISMAGREWAIENYSPTAVAERLLEIIY